jgi:hypothetical protein
MARIDNKLIALLGFNTTGDLAHLTFYRTHTGKIVWFPRAPALNPPSVIQKIIRERFNQAGRDWRLLSQDDRALWLHTSKCCRLMITGYNLWVYWRLTRDLIAITYIESKCGVTLNLGT